MKNYPNKDWLKVTSNANKVDETWKEHLRRILLPVPELAPSNSSFSVHLEQKGHLLKGTFSVHSPTHAFEVESSSQSLDELVLNLKDNMLAQINRWKETRELESDQP